MLIRAIVVCSLLLLTGCGARFVNLTKAPVNAMEQCRDLVEPAGDTMDAQSIAYADSIDKYTDCRQRHKALVDWLRGK